MPPTEKGRMKIKPSNGDAYEFILVKLDAKDPGYRTQNLYDDIKPTVPDANVIYFYIQGGYHQREYGKGGKVLPQSIIDSLGEIASTLERMC